MYQSLFLSSLLDVGRSSFFFTTTRDLPRHKHPLPKGEGEDKAGCSSRSSCIGGEGDVERLRAVNVAHIGRFRCGLVVHEHSGNLTETGQECQVGSSSIDFSRQSTKSSSVFLDLRHLNLARNWY